jgi:hypothetical protein
MTLLFVLFLFVKIDDAKMRSAEGLVNGHSTHGDGQFSRKGLGGCIIPQ